MDLKINNVNDYAPKGRVSELDPIFVQWVEDNLAVLRAIVDRIKIGNGDPNGAVSSTKGSLFLRLDGGTGTTLYVKETSAPTTGWVAK